MEICIVSGYFNPIHPGHISLIQDVKDAHPKSELIVIVNNDHQVKLKDSVPFLDELTRCYILQHIRNVDQVVLSVDTNKAVVKTFDMIHTQVNVDNSPRECNFFFCNGGDRDPTSAVTPEVEFCMKNDIKLEYGFGDDKLYSSSNLIQSACDYINQRAFWRNFTDDLLDELDVDHDI